METYWGILDQGVLTLDEIYILERWLWVLQSGFWVKGDRCGCQKVTEEDNAVVQV